MSIEYFLEKKLHYFYNNFAQICLHIVKENFLESADLPYFVDFRDQQQVPCVRVCVLIRAVRNTPPVEISTEK